MCSGFRRGPACDRCLRQSPWDVWSLRTLSQNFQSTGISGRSDAWRTRTDPPEGASDRPTHRLSRTAVQDRRVRSGISSSVVVPPCQPWCERTSVTGKDGPGCLMGRPMVGSRTRLPHEDGVHYAEAPSFRVHARSPTIERPSRSFASARSSLGVRFPLAPQTAASSK